MRRSSVHFVRFIFHPCLIRNPIHYPSLASIVRERLLKVSRTGRKVRPNISNKDRSAIKGVLTEKLAASILELADLRWPGDGARLTIGPIQTPLMSFGIV